MNCDILDSGTIHSSSAKLAGMLEVFTAEIDTGQVWRFVATYI